LVRDHQTIGDANALNKPDPLSVTACVRQPALGAPHQTGRKKMRVLGLLVCLFGWLIAVLSADVSGVGAQLVVAALGFAIAAFGVLGIVSRGHLKNAIWKA
jgi:hypothetical protein